MAHEHSVRRLRNWYATLLALYPKPYRERFAEPMEQTFNDLLRERATEEERLFGFALWMFVETFAGIVRENVTLMMMQNTRRLIVWAMVVVLILLIPLAMQFTNEVQWNEAIAYGVILFAAGGVFGKKFSPTKSPAFRANEAVAA